MKSASLYRWIEPNPSFCVQFYIKIVYLVNKNAYKDSFSLMIKRACDKKYYGHSIAFSGNFDICSLELGGVCFLAE